MNCQMELARYTHLILYEKSPSTTSSFFRLVNLLQNILRWYGLNNEFKREKKNRPNERIKNSWKVDQWMCITHVCCSLATWFSLCRKITSKNTVNMKPTRWNEKKIIHGRYGDICYKIGWFVSVCVCMFACFFSLVCSFVSLFFFYQKTRFCELVLCKFSLILS